MKAQWQDNEETEDTPEAANSNGKKARPGLVNGIAPDLLKQYIERIERMEESKASIAADIRETFAEAKGSGFDPKVMRKVISLRKMDTEARQEQEELLEIYRHAVGLS